MDVRYHPPHYVGQEQEAATELGKRSGRSADCGVDNQLPSWPKSPDVQTALEHR